MLASTPGRKWLSRGSGEAERLQASAKGSRVEVQAAKLGSGAQR